MHLKRVNKAQLDARRACRGFNRFRTVGGTVIAQSPGIHLARLAGLNAHNDVTVPGPGMFAVEFARASRSVGMRMIPADQFEVLVASTLFCEAHIVGSYFEPISRRVVAAIGKRHQSEHLARTLALAAQNRAAAFVRVGLDAVRPNLPSEFFADLQYQVAHASLQNRSVRYFSPESGNTVTITARCSGGNFRAVSMQAQSAAPELTPARIPSSRASRFTSCWASSVRTGMSASASFES